MMLSDVCLLRDDSYTTFKVTRPLCSPPCWHITASGDCSGGRGNVMSVGKLLLRCRLLGAHGERGGAYRGGRPPTAC